MFKHGKRYVLIVFNKLVVWITMGHGHFDFKCLCRKISQSFVNKLKTKAKIGRSHRRTNVMKMKDFLRRCVGSHPIGLMWERKTIIRTGALRFAFGQYCLRQHWCACSTFCLSRARTHRYDCLNLRCVSFVLELPSESKLIKFTGPDGDLALMVTFRRIFGCPKWASGFFERFRSVMTAVIGVDADAEDSW